MSANDSGMDVTNGGNKCNVFHAVNFALVPQPSVSVDGQLLQL